MSFVRALEMDEVKFELAAEQELESLEKAFDVPEQLRWVREQLASGNCWAWCTAVLRARWGPFVGEACLGGCSYESEEKFLEDSCYYDGMAVDALNDLQNKVEQAAGALEPLMTRESVDEWFVRRVQED